MSRQLEADKELEAVLGSHKTRIRIVGTGGAGNNTVTRLLEVGIKEVKVVAVNTDAQDLLYAKADDKILIGRNITNGLGAGSDPEKGAESAKESLQDLEKTLSDSDMVFITCGLGGGTGTGSAPVIAEISKKIGALTIAIVTLPFSDEGVVRWQNARKGLEQLQKHVDTVIVVQNDRLLDLVPDMPLNAAFKVADEILVNAVKGITELVTQKGLVNLDFADVRAIMENGGLAMIGLGEGEGSNADEAAQKALQNPLLDIDVTGAKSALINISGGAEMSLKDAKTIMNIVSERLDPSAKIIWGARVDESAGNSIRVMLIVTCLSSKNSSVSNIKIAPKPAKSKTDDKPFEVADTDLPGGTPGSGKAAPAQVDAASAARAKNGNKVFSEIFMEESESDIAVLAEAIGGLASGNQSGNEKYLREAKSACSSLYGSSELFSYDKISEFMAVVNDVTQSALDGEFDISENLIGLLEEVPVVLKGMIADEEGAHKRAEEMKSQFDNMDELLGDSNGDTDPDNGVTQVGDSESGEKAKYFDKLF